VSHATNQVALSRRSFIRPRSDHHGHRTVCVARMDARHAPRDGCRTPTRPSHPSPSFRGPDRCQTPTPGWDGCQTSTRPFHPGPASPEPGILSIASKSRSRHDAPGPDPEIPGSPIRRPGMTERWKADVMIDVGLLPPRPRMDAGYPSPRPDTHALILAPRSMCRSGLDPGSSVFGLRNAHSNRFLLPQLCGSEGRFQATRRLLSKRWLSQLRNQERL
jgi:hypothetical protein